MSVLAKSCIKISTKFFFEPRVLNSSMAALSDSVRSKFHIELGRFILNFQKGLEDLQVSSA